MVQRVGKPEVPFNGAESQHPTSCSLLAFGPADRLAALGQLATGLAHELNTPLATIAAHAEKALALLELDRLRATKITNLRRRQEVILQQARRSSEIASRLLQIAQPRRAVCVGCRLEAVLDDVLGLFETAAQRRKVKLSGAVASDMPDLSICAGDLEQLLVNLVQNGLDACDGPGHVRFEAPVRQRQLRLVVADSGRGRPL